MILFLEDWKKYPDAIIHTTTKNSSFLQFAEKLKLMGVKNYFFCLALLQPELEFIDPHDPSLTPEQMVMVAYECVYNPWYYLREVVRVPPQGGAPVAGQLRANRGIIAFFWCFFTHVKPYLIQPRQTGKSLGADFLFSYLLFIVCYNSRITLFTKDNTLRVANVERLKEIRSYLPFYLQAIDKKDSDNTIEVTCIKKNNVFTTLVAQNSESAANNVGRGLTTAVTGFDEGPFCPYIKITMSAMLAAGTAAREEAVKWGAPYGTTFTTTAGKKDSESGKYMYDLLQGGIVWGEYMYDMPNEATLHDVVERGSPGLTPVINITLSHRQLGYSDAWLLKQLKDNNSSGEAADRDFFNRWTSGGLSSPLPTVLNERIRNSQRDPNYSQVTKDSYVLRWYIPEHEIANRMRTGKFIMGMDTSDAIGRDSITVLIIDVSTLDIIAAANISEANLIYLSSWIASLLIEYPSITLIPERKSSGQALIDTLLIRLPAAGIDPFRRIYNVFVDESHEHVDDYQIISGPFSRRPINYYDKNKKYFGFVTAGSGIHSRNALYSDTLLTAAKLTCDNCYDARLIDEITGLVTKNGRIDHATGGHDDMVVAWLLCIWFLTRSKNLSFYGITNALSNVKEYKDSADKGPATPMDKVIAFEQAKIRGTIESLLELLSNTSDDLLGMRIQARIKMLDGKLTDVYNEDGSMDTLINTAMRKTSRQKQQVNRDRRFTHAMKEADYY